MPWPAAGSFTRGSSGSGKRTPSGQSRIRASLRCSSARPSCTAALADERGEGEALFWVGCFHQVVRRDDQTAVPILERSRELAEQAGDKRTMSEALRHLGIAEHRAGRLGSARERLEESTRLRREIGLLPGVAANLVGLAYIAAADGRHDDAPALLAEAAAIADATGAHRITRQVDGGQRAPVGESALAALCAGVTATD